MVLELQDEIVNNLEEKELYHPSDYEYFKDVIEKHGFVLGVFTEKKELVAMGAFLVYGENKHNYGYDIELTKEDILKVGQIESTVVKREFRGNNLQGIICDEILNRATNINKIMATVSPKNPYSLKTFINRDFKIMKEKIKYGGVSRYILLKEI